MAKFRKKPVVIEATQWFKHGDHPEVRVIDFPSLNKEALCGICKNPFKDHGIWDTGEKMLCPSDYFFINEEQEACSLSPDEFENLYERAE